MKYVRQFLIILAISLVGEIINRYVPLPIPASIYGMVILFLLLNTGLLKLESVREVGKGLIEIMPVMFIPAGVGLMNSWGVLRTQLIPICIITVVSLILVFLFSGRTTQYLIQRKQKVKENMDNE